MVRDLNRVECPRRSACVSHARRLSLLDTERTLGAVGPQLSSRVSVGVAVIHGPHASDTDTTAVSKSDR